LCQGKKERRRYKDGRGGRRSYMEGEKGGENRKKSKRGGGQRGGEKDWGIGTQSSLLKKQAFQLMRGRRDREENEKPHEKGERGAMREHKKGGKKKRVQKTPSEGTRDGFTGARGRRNELTENKKKREGMHRVDQNFGLYLRENTRTKVGERKRRNAALSPLLKSSRFSEKGPRNQGQSLFCD